MYRDRIDGFNRVNTKFISLYVVFNFVSCLNIYIDVSSEHINHTIMSHVTKLRFLADNRARDSSIKIIKVEN